MASNDSTYLNATEAAAANLTGPSVANLTFSETLASLPSVLYDHRGMLLLEMRIVFTAMACIYIGSHAALRRPPSARVPKKTKRRPGKRHLDMDDDDKLVQGLVPSDALMFPLLAGVVLVGLYYLIKWLQDPHILNKILGAYFSFISLASMGTLFADSLHFATGFVFPDVWKSADGKLYHVDPARRGQWYNRDSSDDKVYDEGKMTPLPGFGSTLQLSRPRNQLLWDLRRLVTESWSLRVKILGVVDDDYGIRLNDLLGYAIAIIASVFYYTLKPVLLSNIMGFAFTYVGIVMMSPTTFMTGTMVLFGLFFYDIYMVFYTPYMVTVATKLDVPIKLVFEGPTRASMLGLGDIVLPGLFVGLCLRFDHYMYYHRQRKLEPVELRQTNGDSDESETTTTTQRMVVKPDYVNPQGRWGDRFWSAPNVVVGLLSIALPVRAGPGASTSSGVRAAMFPRPYFFAAMFGYLLAMTVTLVVLLVFNHAQPALLYLVPGVVGAAWLAAVARRELCDFWAYTEDGSLDHNDVVVEVDGEGRVISSEPKSKEKKADEQDKDKDKDKDQAAEKDKDGKADEGAGEEKTAKSAKKRGEDGRCVFRFAMHAPEDESDETAPTS